MDRDPIIDTLHGARLEQRLTQVQVAERAGLARNSLSFYETDRTLAPLPKLRAWADALGYDLVLVKREDE
jgi:transcriptional regulator with XRE-family HTH domain